MISHKIQKEGYLLRIEPNEELFTSLKDFAYKKKIKSAFFYGLGACKSCIVGRYNQKTKNYNWRKFNHQMEILNLVGNLTWKNNELYLHVHCTLADKNLKSMGGHLKELVVFPTCEIFLVPFIKKLTRSYDNLTNLHLIDA